MVERFNLYTCCHVRDTRYAEHIDAHVASDDGLLNSGHADQVRAQGAKGPDLRRCLETWPQQPKINTLIEREAVFLCRPLGKHPKMQRISLCHVKEAQAKALVIGSGD